MPGKKLLLIDDDIGIRGFLKDYFEDRDFNVEMAGDGAEGWEKFQKGQYDLVLCDMLMPKMIGLDVLKRIKESKPDQRIIMLSGVTEESMMEKAQKLGCHLYITKPVQLAELEAKVSECFTT